MKVCEGCGRDETQVGFETVRSGGRERKRGVCHTCRENAKRERHPDRAKNAKDRKAKNALSRRQKDPATTIVTDSRSIDKKKGRPGNDLDKEFVQTLIDQGCSYCGSTGLRMTIDRIDNSKAHTKDNVAPACLRCNYIRNDMPYEAWLRLVPTVKELVQEGAFGNWKTKPW